MMRPELAISSRQGLTFTTIRYECACVDIVALNLSHSDTHGNVEISLEYNSGQTMTLLEQQLHIDDFYTSPINLTINHFPRQRHSFRFSVFSPYSHIKMGFCCLQFVFLTLGHSFLLCLHILDLHIDPGFFQ